MEGQSRSLWRDTPHFRFRIESFSTLSASWSKRYESNEFTAGGYKWKLALYPNGNASKDVNDHLSLYLVMAEKSGPLFEDILVSFALLVFDHVQEIYLSVQEVGHVKICEYELGFDRFLPLKIFKEPSNGYLVKDNCMFGADVFIKERRREGQCLSMAVLKPAPYKHTWKIENFSKRAKHSSEKFTTRGHDWVVRLSPKGNSIKDWMSLHLDLADEDIGVGRQVLAEITFRLVDQVKENHTQTTGTWCFNALNKTFAKQNFFLLDRLKNLESGYLVKGACILEAEVIVLGSAKGWD